MRSMICGSIEEKPPRSVIDPISSWSNRTRTCTNGVDGPSPSTASTNARVPQ